MLDKTKIYAGFNIDRSGRGIATDPNDLFF